MGQSQPRVSRHLKLLVEAGLLQRFREGSLVFYRLAEQYKSAHLARTLVDLLPADDATLTRDLNRLETTRQKRVAIAENYFRENAGVWDKIRALYVPEAVEQTMLDMAGTQRIKNFLDIGTGTGRMLQLFAAQFDHGIGIDTSSEMLSIARSQLESDEYRHVKIRKGDMYNMPIDDDSIDMAVLHLVLHYSQDPAAVIFEAARTLIAKGRFLVVDFASHQEEFLREQHQHRRMGFADKDIELAFAQAGMQLHDCQSLQGDPLTVKIWEGRKMSP
jgi:ArsR family transcriptional regulator